MKNTLLLTEYNLRAIRKPLTWMFVLMGPLEYCVMMAYLIVMKGPLFHPPHRFFMAGMLVPAICILIGAVLNFYIALRQSGRSKAIYTLLTLPGNRAQVYLSSVLSGLVTVWLTAAVQALWYMILYVPVARTIDWYSARFLTEKVEQGLLSVVPNYSSCVENGFFLHLMRSPAMRMLFPMSSVGFVIMLMAEISTIACLQAITFTRGVLRVLTTICFAFCVVGTMASLLNTVEFIFIPMLSCSISTGMWLIAAQLCSAVISIICAVYSLKHSKVL